MTCNCCMAYSTAMLQIPLAASASEVAEPKLAWWVDALQQLLHSSSQSSAIVTQDTVEPASLQHPALRRLQGSPLLSFLRAVPLTDWLQDLQQAIEPQPLPDSAELIHCYWQLARPLGWLDMWLIDATNWQQMTAAARRKRDRPAGYPLGAYTAIVVAANQSAATTQLAVSQHAAEPAGTSSIAAWTRRYRPRRQRWHQNKGSSPGAVPARCWLICWHWMPN